MGCSLPAKFKRAAFQGNLAVFLISSATLPFSGVKVPQPLPKASLCHKRVFTRIAPYTKSAMNIASALVLPDAITMAPSDSMDSKEVRYGNTV
jgi:hypothetical protein